MHLCILFPVCDCGGPRRVRQRSGLGPLDMARRKPIPTLHQEEAINFECVSAALMLLASIVCGGYPTKHYLIPPGFPADTKTLYAAANECSKKLKTDRQQCWKNVLFCVATMRRQ